MGLFDQIVQQYSNNNQGGGGSAGGGSVQQQPRQEASWYVPNTDSQYTPGNSMPYAQGGNTWQNFVDNYAQIRQANRRDSYQNNRQSPFSMSGGTESLYNNRYRKADKGIPEQLAIAAGEGGKWWNDLPGQIGGPDWSFDANKFDLSNGFDMQDATQLRNFLVSIPGMIPGGLLEGVEKGYEAATGRPIQERRKASDGTWEYADYELDANQRFAAGLDAAINIGGTALGGSGKLVSVAGKGLMRAGAKAAGGAATDLGKRMGNAAAAMGGGALEKAGFGKGAQFAYNVGQEAGEEFVQSYMDDMRMKHLDEGSLDRAMTGAAWGALGGAVMHGAGAAGNALLHGAYDKTMQNLPDSDPQQQIAAGVAQQEQFERFQDRNRAYQGSSFTPSIIARANEKLKDPERVAASASAFGTVFADDLDLTQTRLSLEVLDGICQTADDGKSIAGLAKAFRTTPDRIIAINSMRDDGIRHAAWKNLLDEAQQAGPVKIIVGRNPDTNAVGTHYVDVVDIVKGGGMQLNATAWKMLGGDVDGDKYQTYLHPSGGVRAAGYLTQSLTNSATGRSNLDSDYVKFYKKPKAVAGFRESLEEFNRSLPEGSRISSKDFGKLVVDFNKANNGSLENVSEFFSRMRTTVYSHLGDDVDRDLKWDIADRQVAKMMHDTHLFTTRTARDFEDVVTKLSEDQVEEIEQATKSVEEDMKWLRSGDNKGKTHAADFLGLFGQRIGINTGINLGNAIMRQSGANRYLTKEEQDVWFDSSLNTQEVQDRFTNLIAYSFALENIGAEVENSIEGVFWVSVVDSTLSRFRGNGSNARIDLSGNWNEFLDILTQEYESKASDFNAVLSRNSTQYGEDVVIGAKKKESISGSIADKAQVFHKAFGSFKVQELFAIPKTHLLYDMTIDQVIAEYGISSGKDLGPFSNIPGFDSFFKYVVEDEGSNLRSLDKRYMATISEFANKLISLGFTDIVNHVKVTRGENGQISGVTIDTQDYEALRMAIDSAQFIFGEDESIYMNIGSMEGFLTTQWGAEWMSGDVDRMTNATFSIKLSYMYKDVINLITKKPEGWENEVEIALRQLAENGYLEKVIYASWEENKDLGLLRSLTSLDVQWSKKVQIWEQLSQGFGNAGPLLSELFATANTDLGTSVFTKKLKNAKRSMLEASRRSLKQQRDVIERVQNLQVDDSTKLSAIKHFISSGYTTMSTNAIAAFVHSQRDIVKGMIDKGVAPTTSDIVYQISEHVKNGGLFSFLEGIDYGFGTMAVGKLQVNRVQLLNVFNDPDVRIRVYDPNQGGYLWVSRDEVFNEVLGEDPNRNVDTDWSAWEALFNRCPALVSLFTPTHIGTRTKDGVPSVTEGIRVPLDRAIVDFMDENKDTTNQYEARQIENEAIQIAMRDPNWWSALVADTTGIGESASLAETHDLVKSAIRKHAKWLVTYASMDPNGAGYFQKCYKLGEHAVEQAFQNVEDIARDNRVSQIIRSFTGTTEASMQGQMLNWAMRSVMKMGMNNLLASQQLHMQGDQIAEGAVDPQQQANQANQENAQSASAFIQTVNSNAQTSFNQMTEESVNAFRILYTLFNMVDTRMFRFNEYIESFGIIDDYNAALDEYVSNSTDPNAQQKAAAVRQGLQNWRDGGLSGFSSYVFGGNVLKANQNMFSEIIPSEAVTEWTEKQFVDAVDAICKKYNFNESKGKIAKDIKHAFDDATPAKEQISERENIKNYFNQIILEYSLKRMTPAGQTYNLLASKQTLEAYKTMFALGDKVREALGDRLEYSAKELPELNFNFGDPTVACMSAHTAMNAASGSITTGIGLDGSMLNLVAGLGLLDDYACGVEPATIQPQFLTEDYIGWSYIQSDGKIGHLKAGDIRKLSKGAEPIQVYNPSECLCGSCSTCAPALPSYSARRADGSNKQSFLGVSVATLINWMQEASHLKQKKSLGVINAFSDPMKINKDVQRQYSIEEVRRRVESSRPSGQQLPVTARELALESLRMRRSVVAKALHDTFSDPDVQGDLHFDEGHDRHSRMFANVMTNLIEVRVAPDQANGIEGGVFYISSSALANDETFARYDFGWGPGIIDSDNVTFNPVVMSLQEVSEKVIRDIAEKYYAAEDQGEKLIDSDIRKLAGDSIRNWDKYNNRPITMAGFLDGIVANPAMVDNPMLGDMNYSSRMLWNDSQIESLARVLAPRNVRSNELMGKDAWNKVASFNEALSNRNKLEQFFYNHRIVSVFSSNDQRMPSQIDMDKSNLLPSRKDTGTAIAQRDESSGRSYELVEMYIGSNNSDAKDAYNRASKNGRALLCPYKVAQKISSTIPAFDIMTAKSVTIDGESYVMINPRYRQYLESFSKENMLIGTTEMDPSEISLAVGSENRLGAPDAGHWTHPDFRSGKKFSMAVDISPTKLLRGGAGSVSLVTDASEIANIRPSQIDFSYYENNIKNKDISVFQDRVDRFIKNAESWNGEMPKCLHNVKRDDCIGFVAQPSYNGQMSYAPIFYEGSVAKTADTVILRERANGKIRASFSTEFVDYNGEESVKLDMYGVAYKSVGHVATPDILKKWAAINDGGFNVFTRADHMFDAMSVASRLIEMGDALLHRNMYFFTRKAGINAFYTRQGNTWVKRDLNPLVTPAILQDLCSGSPTAWSMVADGTLPIYNDSKQNQYMQRITQDVLALGGFPHLFFNSARIDPETGAFVGLERRFFDPQAVFKYWNTDDFLSFYNFQDNRLCPASLSENPDTDGQVKVFDKRGWMLDMNTISGDSERKVTFCGPNYYTGEGTPTEDLSRGASWSNQHILKRLLDDGIFRGSVKDTIDALSVAVGKLDRVIADDSIEEEIDDWRRNRKDEAAYIDPDMMEKARQAVKDPLYISLIEQRRRKMLDINNELPEPLMIVHSSKNQDPITDDSIKMRDVKNAVANLNSALKSQNGMQNLTLSETMMLVKLVTGYTSNDGRGVNHITFAQFENAVDTMVKNLNNGEILIVGGEYKTRGDDRVSIPLMPRGLASRLMATKYYQDMYHGDMDAMLNDQYEAMRASIEQIKVIKNKAKRNALLQMADAMCYANGRDPLSGHLIEDVYMYDLMKAAKDFAFALTDYDPALAAQYDEAVRLNDDWANKVKLGEQERQMSRIKTEDGDYIVQWGDRRNVMTYVLRQMTAARRAMGLTYLEMPLSNMLDRSVGQAGVSMAMRLGRIGIGPYQVSNKMNNDIREAAPKSEDLRKFWSAMREAQLLGVDRELLNHIYSGEDLDTAIQSTLKEQGAIERFSNKVMNIASGKDVGIEKQIQNFIDRVWQVSEEKAPWWHQKIPGHDMTIFEEKLATDPVGLMTDLFSGSGEGKAADLLMTRQCLQFALAGDMAQKNLVSAIFGEIAKKSSVADFAMTTMVTPYFQYATNRLGKVLNAVAPISSLHYLATQFMTEGPGGAMRIAPWSEVTFSQLGLEEVQVKASLKEAIYCDMAHMGGGLVGMLLAAMALNMPGVLEPPEDDDKKGNFEEWTFMGMRINANWWVEDSLGIALPLATFWVSALRGEPRIDLISNGLAHYLGNNPVVKVADAVSILFDPMAELYREYEQDLDGYAKAMGGAPDIWQILNGKLTSFGLSYAAQFITPGILREIYQASQGNEVAYKRVFETDATGKLTLDARENNKTMYASYEDATIRKFTKDNPVMGFLADIIMRPETGYMNHEMPDRIIYDPEQMNSIQAFSIYEDPYTKQVEKPASEQMAVALMVISTLQSNSTEELVRQGFMIDYDTKRVTSQLIWDMIAAENAQWASLEQAGALSYYNGGYGDYDENVRVISEMREAHKAYISNLQDLYHNKLWSEDLKSPAMYNQKNTEWAQDVNGNWYATGFAPTVLSPFQLASGETPGFPQAVMSRENDWQTQSIVSGNPTGQRSLVPIDLNRVEMPDKPKLNSWSEDGTDTGHSALYNSVLGENASLTTNPDNTSANKTSTRGKSTGYPSGYGSRRSGGGGGGYRRYGGGGSGSGSGGYSRSGYTPNTSAPSARAPISAANMPNTGLSKVNVSRTMNTDRLVEPGEIYLRPDFETKGSREAYKRSDI